MFLTGTLEWRTYEYFVLQFEIDYLDRKQRFEETVGLLPIKVFANSGGDQISIYQVPQDLRLYPE